MTASAEATVVVELTPPGRAAVAVIIVAGPEALRAVDSSFVARSGRAVGQIPIGRIVLGHWDAPEGEELIVCRRDEERIEVHCHGGTAAVEAVISRLTNEGCQRLTWQEWINRCAPDRIRAAARIALADAVTERTAAILLDQLNGALTAAVQGTLANVAVLEWSSAALVIDELLSRRELGLHLTNPWRVVVIGPPNVGKSSLINALAGYERAIVSPTSGTTRDVVSITTAMDGWPVQLSDTAGIRVTQDELESAGIELATNALSRAELAILVYDAAALRKGMPDAKTKVENTPLASHARAIHVINKSDLLLASERSPLCQGFTNSLPEVGQPHLVSALHGEAVAELMTAIVRALVPVSFPAGSAVPFTAEQVEVLADAKTAIQNRNAKLASELLNSLLT